MGSSTERARSAVLAVKLNLKRQLEPDRGIVQLPDAEISTDIPTTTMDQIIIDRLTEIATLVPNHISIALIHAVYPKGLSSPQSADVNLLLSTIVTWYLDSVRLFKDRAAEKDKMIEAMQRLVESTDMVTTLRDTIRVETNRKWGSVTRAQAWKLLQDDGRVGQNMFIQEQQHPSSKILTSKLSALQGKTWKKELDMFPDFIGAIKEGLYNETNDIFVVDTSQRNDFHADVSVATYDDDRLPYSVRYFLEFKLPSVEPRTAAHCGQMLDYFKSIREKQPHRSRFIGVLSNYSSSWVYDAVFDETGPKIQEYLCQSLADAIIFAETSSASQLRATIPSLDKALDPKFSVLSVGKHHFLLSVKKAIPRLDDMRKYPTRSQTVKNTATWFPPRRHQEPKNQFVLKIAHSNRSLDNEITILGKLRNAESLHIPELVWIRGSGELGILPIGQPVLPGESAAVSRKVVRGMIDGLRYLHGQGIIHRDVRLSNLILKWEQNDVNVVIIDYETAFDSWGHRSTDYSGGYICWPRRLLQSGEQLYMPEPADDLFACILVVLHLLFPCRFDKFNAGSIQADGNQNSETLDVLKMWEDIENSKIWGKFYQAARDQDYDGLLEISDVFCHV
ncbi:hypothetical protein BGW80DRAFT_1335442 [Lactifluus volemus]|nr:hypothetical protein BGW80DRAFT_1335442 [Lactifluus volemus]